MRNLCLRRQLHSAARWMGNWSASAQKSAGTVSPVASGRRRVCDSIRRPNPDNRREPWLDRRCGSCRLVFIELPAQLQFQRVDATDELLVHLLHQRRDSRGNGLGSRLRISSMRTLQLLPRFRTILHGGANLVENVQTLVDLRAGCRPGSDLVGAPLPDPRCAYYRCQDCHTPRRRDCRPPDSPLDRPDDRPSDPTGVAALTSLLLTCQRAGRRLGRLDPDRPWPP